MKAKVVQINVAEGMIDAMWDPKIREKDKWKVKDGSEHGLKINWDNWAFVPYEWASRPQDRICLSMERDFAAETRGEGVDISDYDTLLFSLVAPEKSQVTLSAKTDKGDFTVTTDPVGTNRVEVELPYKGQYLYHATLSISTQDQRPGSGWLNWLGVSSKERMPRFFAKYKYDTVWDGYLVPEGTTPEFRPHFGVFFDEADLEIMRERYFAAGKCGKDSIWAPDYSQNPEDSISDAVQFMDDNRFGRAYMDDKQLLGREGKGANYALYGLLEKDEKALRLAARYAMSLFRCDRWDQGIMSHYPGGIFDHRCFVQSLVVYDLAFILDAAWELFTPLAQRMIFRKMAEEGFGSIQFICWKYEYMFYTNQIAWFVPARMASLSLMEKVWPRVKPYRELVYQDLVENMKHTIFPDGGYQEGPSYAEAIGRDGGRGFYLYARAAGLPLDEIIPECVRRTANLARITESTVEGQDYIPICDSAVKAQMIHLAFMAYMLPESRWVDMYRKKLREAGGVFDDMFSMVLDAKIPQKTEEKAGVVQMPDTGITVVEWSKGKLLFMGAPANAGHQHEDKGSFVLEYDRESFACDPGICNYSSPFCYQYKTAQRHNMLLPVGTKERPAPLNPCPYDIKPRFAGDDEKFTVDIDAGLAWPDYYEYWKRNWEFTDKRVLKITDSWKLKESCGANGAAFCWNTVLPVGLAENEIYIKGSRSKVVIKVPESCTVEVKYLDNYEKDVITNQILIVKNDLCGEMTVEARLE